MATEQARQEGHAVTERQAVAPVAEVQDFSPPATATWPDIANQCWSGDIKGCATSLGQKLSETFGFGSTEATQQLQREGKLPELTLIGGGDTTARDGDATARGEVKPRGDAKGDAKGDGADALPKALQGDNKKRTETVMDGKADPQERLKAASELIGAGVTSFTVQSEDGSINKVRLEKEKVSGDRSMLGVYVSNKKGVELNALRAVEKGDGTLVQQKDSSGRAVDFKNRGAALLDRLSLGGTIVEEAAKPAGKKDAARTDAVGDGAPLEKEKLERKTKPAGEPERDKAPEREKTPPEKKRTEPDKAADGEFKSPYQRRYEEGDKFKGITSVYWEDSQTASGIRFNKDEHTAASREFPFGTILNVRNPETGKETKVVITDHGPFAGKKEPRPDGSERVHNRVLDIARGAANAIGMTDTTPRAMEITVVSIPEGGAWGADRRNLRSDGKKELLATARRLTEEGRRQ
jgi:rare lipoprotein A (peptidoglycan hydrolase)